MNYLQDLTDVIFNFVKNNKNWDAHSMAAYIDKETEKLGYKISEEKKDSLEYFMCPNCKSKEFVKSIKESKKSVLAKEGFVELEEESTPVITVTCKGCNAEIDYEKSIKVGNIIIKNLPLKLSSLKELSEVPGLNMEEVENIEDKIEKKGNLIKRNPIKI